MLYLIQKFLTKKSLNYYLFAVIFILYLSLIVYLAFELKTPLDTIEFWETQNQQLLSQLNSVNTEIEEAQMLGSALDNQFNNDIDLLNEKISEIKDLKNKSESKCVRIELFLMSMYIITFAIYAVKLSF